MFELMIFSGVTFAASGMQIHGLIVESPEEIRLSKRKPGGIWRFFLFPILNFYPEWFLYGIGSGAGAPMIVNLPD